MVVGKLVFISLSVFSSVFMCFFFCFSCFLLLYGNSRITIHKSQLEHRFPRYTDQICHKVHQKYDLVLVHRSFLEKKEKRWKIPCYLLLNRFYTWINIYISDKYRTILKKPLLSDMKQQKHNNKRKLQSKLPRFITTTNYFEHSPNILNIQSKHE